jgi:hypothetical protein
LTNRRFLSPCPLVTFWVVIATLLGSTIIAVHNPQTIPTDSQNFFKYVLKFIWDMSKTQIGEEYGPWVSFIGTLFLIIFVSNWLGTLSLENHTITSWGISHTYKWYKYYCCFSFTHIMWRAWRVCWSQHGVVTVELKKITLVYQWGSIRSSLNKDWPAESWSKDSWWARRSMDGLGKFTWAVCWN